MADWSRAMEPGAGLRVEVGKALDELWLLAHVGQCVFTWLHCNSYSILLIVRVIQHLKFQIVESSGFFPFKDYFNIRLIWYWQ